MATPAEAIRPEVGAALCRVLRQGRDVHRCRAARALGRIGYEGAVAPLIASLLDEDEDVRADAAEALGRLGDRRGGEPLAQSLAEDPCGDVKVNAVEALGRLGDTSAVQLLRRLVRGRDESVAWDEEELLGAGWDDWLDVQAKAIQALGDMGAAEAVPDIVAALDDEMGQDLSEAGMHALARLGEVGIPALANYLQAQDERLRRRAVRALSEAGSGPARDALAGALSDESPNVRLGAIRGLAARDPADPRLAPLFDDPHPAVRAAMVGLCARHWPERLDVLLDDPSDEVQVAVLERLATGAGLPRPENLELRLRVKLRGPSEDVARSACRAIAAIAPAVALEDLSEQVHDRGCPLEVRRGAAKGLGELGTDKAVRVLRDAAGDDARLVRIEAAGALGRMASSHPPSASAREALLAALRGELVPAPEAGGALGSVERGGKSIPEEERAPNAPMVDEGEAKEAVPAHRVAEAVVAEAAPVEEAWPKSTLESLTAGNRSVAPTVLPQTPVALDETDLEYMALARKRPRKKRVSLEPTVPVHEDVRRFAARVLGDVADERVVSALAATLHESDLELRRAAADSLARLAIRMGYVPAAAVHALTRALDDDDCDLRFAATRALGRGGHQETAALIQRLKDPDSHVRAEAARSLAALNAVGPDVDELLSDQDPGVRLAAAEAVATRGGPETVRRLVDFAFAHEGMHGREAAVLLRRVDRAAASRRFVRTLEDAGQERYWGVAIEALEELHRSDAAPADQQAA